MSIWELRKVSSGIRYDLWIVWGASEVPITIVLCCYCGSTNNALCEALQLRYKHVSVWSACASAIALTIFFIASGRLFANTDATCDR
jgi:hypothetical protein